MVLLYCVSGKGCICRGVLRVVWLCCTVMCVRKVLMYCVRGKGCVVYWLCCVKSGEDCVVWCVIIVWLCYSVS